jgi:glycosyltransferase involved in cell wall biosynthesis
MACGTPVIASDLRVLREVGGDAAVYCRVADIEQWAATVNLLLQEKDSNPANWNLRRARALARASQFTWSKFAASMSQLYSELPSVDFGNLSRVHALSPNGNS